MTVGPLASMMKKRISLFVCTLTFAVAVAQAQSTNQQNLYKNWKFYTANGEKFSVALPVYPSMQTVLEKREKPGKDRQIRLLRASNNGVAYTIYVVENPDQRQSLDEFIKEQTSNPTLDLTNTKDQGSKSDPFVWWGTYTVKDEEFSIRLPTIPAMTISKVFNRRLAKDRLERRLRTSLEGVVYTIDVFENVEPGQLLEEFITQENQASEFDLATERKLIVNNVAGKEYSSGKTPLAVVQFFATKWRLYRFAVSGAGLEHAGVKVFFSSIQLDNKNHGVEVTEGPGSPLELDGERIYTGKEVDVKPQLLSKPEPQYSFKAGKERVSGRVVLRAVFSATGEVKSIVIVSGLPHGLTEQAIAAARMITFTPAIKDGRPVSMWMQLEYNFNI